MIENSAAESAAPPTCDSARRASAPMTLLLVDDNQTFITAVRQFLDRMPGIRIVGQAHDGKTALDLQRKHHPALVLLDIGMPGMNGLELARAMLQHAAPPELVFLSVHDNREYRAAAREIGAEFVSKADVVSELLPLLGNKVRANAMPAAQRLREAADPGQPT